MKNINEFLSMSKGLRPGFTLAEVLTVTVILGVMAGVAIPTYNGIIEKQGANEAYVNLQTIYRAEKLYHTKNGQYWISTSPSGDTDLSSVTSNLNIDLRQPKYYPFFMIVSKGNSQTGFKAWASKTSSTGAAYTLWADNLGQTLPGDASGDGDVDGADYTLWADQYGQTGPGLAGDFNLDGTVDGGDYTILSDHYGQTLPGDFNHDGIVNGGDYTQWADEYGNSMASIDEKGDYNAP